MERVESRDSSPRESISDSLNCGSKIHPDWGKRDWRISIENLW